MPPMFDPTPYTTVPTRSAAATMSLARALLSAAGSRPPASLAKRLAKLRAWAKRLQSSWVDASRPVVAIDLRPFDLILDRRWSAVRSRLDGCVQLGDDDHTPRAEAMLEGLFPTGLDFLRLPYAEQWAQSERRLALIETDGLEDELEELVGERYLPLLRQAHDAYGEALGITAPKEAAPESARVIEPLQALKDAIASYARGVIGTVDEDDEDSIRAALEQLQPILDARRPRAPGEAAVEEPAEPVEAPVPELPAVPEPAAAVAE